MMGYYWGNMMGGISVVGVFTWIVVIVDLVLLGILLWQKIKK